MKDFKWVIQSNQIKDCPVMVHDIGVSLKIWGKNIGSKTNLVVRDYVKFPKELLKLHKDVF
jgi:hypothetical protein